MEPQELTKILDAHKVWLNSSGKGGQRADLEGANLQAAIELRSANLQGAILNRAEFKNADLTNANFQGTELRRTSFDGAILRGTNFREVDLQNANFEEANFLLTSQLAGANVAGAKLPRPVAEFEGLKTIAEATSNAQKLFIAMLGGCLYSWLTIGTTTDAALLTNSASSPLPIIGTALPIVGFYLVAPVILLALYFYFHLNMQRLWEALADLPAVFPDGRSLDKKADPWLLNGLVNAHFARLRQERPSLSRVQQWLSILLAWWVVPATLFIFWARFLVRHDRFGTLLQLSLLATAIGFGWMSYRLARMTLRGARRNPFRWSEAWKDRRTFKRVAGILGTFVIAAVLFFVPRILGAIGLKPFLNLSRVDISAKPANWTGDPKEYPLVRGARLSYAEMKDAAADDAFLVNADLRFAHLDQAFLMGANLSHANLLLASLQGAILHGANLSNANLISARLMGARLEGANLSGANLGGADLMGANLGGANLSDANLGAADLSGANLVSPYLGGANLSGANLGNVDLRGVKGLTRGSIAKARTNAKTLIAKDLPP